MSRIAARLLSVLACSLIFLPTRADAQQISYVYDEAGRLIQVTDAIGDSAFYYYDAVGNVISIARVLVSTVAIRDFRPSEAALGASVTITGSGFSATPSQNTVTFNGTAATVSTASANTLVVVVPSGATTGTIGVVSPSGSATSTGPFTVLTDTGEPTITNVTPSIGVTGSTLTVTGTNFESTLHNNRASVGDRHADTPSGTTTTLTAAVPVSVGGKVKVATPHGLATSATDFFIPPWPLTASDVQTTARLSPNTSTPLTLSSANKHAMLLFDAPAGQALSVSASASFGGCFNLEVFAPHVQSMGVVGNCGGAGFYDAITTGKSGTYGLLLFPFTNTGTASLVLNTFSHVIGAITPNAAATAVTIASPGQNASYTFNATAGQVLTATVVNVSWATCAGTQLKLLKPDKSVLAVNTLCGSSGMVDWVTAPTSGVYTVVLDPAGAAIGTADVAAYVFNDLTGSLTPNASPTGLTINYPGQNAVYTFTATAGQVLTATTNMSWSGCNASRLTLFNPNGSLLKTELLCGASGMVDWVLAPATGTYTVVFDPWAMFTGTASVAIYAFNDLTGSLTANASPTGITIDYPGRNAVYTFTATAGQVLSATAVMSWSGCNGARLTLFNPNGSLLKTELLCGTSGMVDWVLAPATGTYTVVFDPWSMFTGTADIGVYAFNDVSGGITPNASPTGVTINYPGQNAVYTFSATAGQTLSATVSAMSWSDCPSARLTIFSPIGLLTTDLLCGTGGTTGPSIAPATGTYVVVFDPSALYAGTADVAVAAW